MQNHDLAGWMPARGEFETEWLNDAEWTLADMEQLDTDPPELRGMIMEQLLWWWW